jgi:hypothetical protein
MSNFLVKGPRTYRKKYPGRYVVAVLLVTPEDTDMLFEMAVDKPLFEQLRGLCVDEIKKRAGKKGEDTR